MLKKICQNGIVIRKTTFDAAVLTHYVFAFEMLILEFQQVN